MSEHTDLWAKTADDKTQKHNFHPVICHLLDTAAVCKAMLKLLPPAAIERLARGLGIDRDALFAWVPFLTGSHDTGKISPPFQFRDSDISEVARKLCGGSLYDLWLERPKIILDSQPPFHGTLTACTLPEYLKLKSCGGITEDLAEELAAVVGGHHGIFPQYEEIQNILKSTRKRQFHIGDSDKAPQWRQWRIEILDILADFCKITDRTPPQSCDAGAAVILASITTFSDWLASDQKIFTPAGSSPDLDKYIESLATKVQKSLTATQWHQWQPHDRPLNFSQLFGRAARNLQETIEAIMPQIKGKPTLLIVEAPTGEGKTETALTVAHWHTSSGMPGSYIGMPTQATGNALYERLEKYLNKWYANQKINFQLIHSASQLNDDFTKSICRLSNIYDSNNSSRGGVSASEWFASRKRALLAPWGVGTVDAALMGILRKKHQFLYLLGLAGKTVILDEVHAYDGYTSQLLDRLVHWCAILGSPVVILSATLNQERRQSLLNSYAEGLGLANPELPTAKYPRLTIFPIDNKAIVSPEFTRDKLCDLNFYKKIKICWIDESEIKNIVGKGATAIIRSTVTRCQRTAEDYPEADLFHSRFTQEHRRDKEKKCLAQYGEPKDEDEPAHPPSLIVATQVIEQSLNVDFDVLISDLCPIDLLIQRIGRLWRFKRNNRNVDEKVIYLIKPSLKDGIPNFGDDVEGKKGKSSYQVRVYDRHCLLRTYYWLNSRKAIELPNDIDDAIEQVYNLDKEPNIQLSEIQLNDWKDSLTNYQNWQSSIEGKAEQVIIPDLKNYPGCEGLTRRDLSEKDAEMVTRLISDSMNIVVDIGDGKVIIDRQPKGKEINQILRQQVPISNRGVIRAIEAEISIPKHWKHVAYLRDLRVLSLKPEQETIVGDYRITYCPRMGLICQKISK